MTDDEINSSVARKLGWELLETAEPDLWKERKWKSPPIIKDGYVQPIPDYCHSIQAAWAIIEWAIHNQKAFNLNVTSTMTPMWEAGFFSRGDVQADTAPMAICLAFLKLST